MFGWLKRDSKFAQLKPGRGWTVEVVGEASYQEDLHRVYRRHGGTVHDLKVSAVLEPEHGNPHDPNAVMVVIDRRTVGYLPRGRAAEYRGALGRQPAGVSAKIIGGFKLDDGSQAHYGVRLNVSWPPKLQ